MQRNDRPPVDPKQQREKIFLDSIANQVNKLRRKFEAELDPIQDRIDALTTLQTNTTVYINEITAERNGLIVDLQLANEKNDTLEKEIEKLNKQLKKKKPS